MSLSALVASFDDKALVALANKGLMRRAVEAVDDTKVERFAEDGAELAVGGQHVSIPPAGPQTATCDCSAAGICSHILTAMLVLRDQSVAEPQTTGLPQPRVSEAGAADWLAAMDAFALRKFAGADHASAMALAGSADIQDRGANAHMGFASPEASVTFVADQPLGSALYKGPASRKLLVIAAAAMAIRDRAGVPRPVGDADAKPPGHAAPTHETLGAISQALEAAIAQVFHGSAALAQERLLDLAISARIQSAPRLTGQLLTLSAQAGWADAGDMRIEGGWFLGGLAQAYALVTALGHRPDDPILLGVACRHFEPAPAMKLWTLGA